MKTRMLFSALLLSLGLTLPVWAKTVVEAPPPPEVQEAPPEQADVLQKPVTPAMPTRGQMLYENHCTTCHESVVHVRDNRRTQSLTELRERVVNWSGYLYLHWSKDEVEEVVHHLNSQYYKFETH